MHQRNNAIKGKPRSITFVACPFIVLFLVLIAISFVSQQLFAQASEKKVKEIKVINNKIVSSATILSKLKMQEGLEFSENILNEERIQLMRKNAIIINTARGSLIDEKALLKALKNKDIAGAALDVYREEPLKDTELINCMDNLVLTPHIASQTIENQVNAATMIAEKISDFLKKFK